MDNTKLLPCPFCGKIPGIQSNSGNYGYIPAFIYIKCCHIKISEDSEAWTPQRGHYDVTSEAKEKIIKLWNTRYQGDKIGK